MTSNEFIKEFGRALLIILYLFLLTYCAYNSFQTQKNCGCEEQKIEIAELKQTLIDQQMMYISLAKNSPNFLVKNWRNPQITNNYSKSK